MNLSQLTPGAHATVTRISELSSEDVVAHRLRDLGFVAGEPVSLVALGPFGSDPLLVQVGYTRFALRRSEAARVEVQPGKA
ncbi:MAG: FeoA family protein [Candidatus Dactylopiibacterium sp.]|nr:FeoA family protein [Candidatus Dactylopiibacterium sp.]